MNSKTYVRDTIESINAITAQMREFLISRGITVPKHLYINKFLVRKGSSFCERGLFFAGGRESKTLPILGDFAI